LNDRQIPNVRAFTWFTGMGGMLGQLTYPMLLIKSRLQAESKHTTYKYNGTWDCIRRIAQTEGLAAFYEGMRTKIVQSVLGAALMFMLKEEIDKSVTKLLRPDPKLLKAK
jgi:adenine nucleotide transporter 17